MLVGFTADSLRLVCGYTALSFSPSGTAKVFQGAMDAGIDKVILKTDEVGPMGAEGVAYERGHYTFLKADGSVADLGK